MKQPSAQYGYSLAHLFVVGRLSKSLDSINVRRESGPLIPLSGSKISREHRKVWVNTCTQCCQWQSKRSGHKGQKVLTDGSIPVAHKDCTGFIQKMSPFATEHSTCTTDYQQPSHLDECRVHRGEERYISPPSASAEQPVRIYINSYLRKIWQLATSTIVTQGSWGNFTNAARSTTTPPSQCMSNNLEHVWYSSAQCLFYQRHNVDARCANISMIGGDQHFHIIEFHPQINYLPGTNNGRAVCAWISSYKELKPTGNLIERHYFARTLHHLYSRHRCHRFLPDYSCIFVDVISVLRWRPRLPRNIIYSRFEGGIKP